MLVFALRGLAAMAGADTKAAIGRAKTMAAIRRLIDFDTFGAPALGVTVRRALPISLIIEAKN